MKKPKAFCVTVPSVQIRLSDTRYFYAEGDLSGISGAAEAFLRLAQAESEIVRLLPGMKQWNVDAERISKQLAIELEQFRERETESEDMPIAVGTRKP